MECRARCRGSFGMFTTTTSLGIRVHLELALVADADAYVRRLQLCYALELVAVARQPYRCDDGAIGEWLASVASSVREGLVNVHDGAFTKHMRQAFQSLDKCDASIQTSGL